MSQHFRAHAVGALFFSSIIVLALSTLQASAQTSPPTPRTQTRKPSADSNATANALLEQRRATAISLLTSLADDAKSFRDGALRARAQARAADALWETDQERARALFNRAWEAADAADKDSARRVEEELQRQFASGRSTAGVTTSPSNLRTEILNLAARRDRALGESFLAKLDEDVHRDAADASTNATTTNDSAASSNNDPMRTSPAIAERLELASRLLETGDTQRALQFAAPALARVNIPAIDFLSYLREKMAVEADKLYASLLVRAAADPMSDAATVSLLSSYILTPHLYLIVSRSGASSSQSGSPTPPPAVAPELRTAFFRVAAEILLRPVPPSSEDKTFAGRAGTYFVIARLLPVFEQQAPQRVAELRAQLAALMPSAPERFRSGNSPMLTRGLIPEDSATRDDVQEALDRISSAPDAASRDRVYASAALAAARRNDARARELVEKIEDAELRQQVSAYVDYSAVRRAVQRKDAPEIIRLARNGDLTRIQRVWAYTQAARLMLKPDRASALQLLDEAATEARRIGASDPERAQALVGVTRLFVEADRTRVWEMLAETVRAANAASDFTGEDAQTAIRVQTKDTVSVMSNNTPDFDLPGLFNLLARDDLYRAIDAAKSFTGEAPRAIATLAIARTVLAEKIKDTRN